MDWHGHFGHDHISKNFWRRPDVSMNLWTGPNVLQGFEGGKILEVGPLSLSSQRTTGPVPCWNFVEPSGKQGVQTMALLDVDTLVTTILGPVGRRGT